MPMKAIMLCIKDVDPGATQNEIVLRCEVNFCGSDVPGGAINTMGAEGNGVPVALNLNQLANYANNVEDAFIAEATRLGLPTLNRTDVLYINYQRGS
jgi:hypothetical protein